MKGINRAGLIEALEAQGYYRNRRLKSLKIPRSTYYTWRRRYEEGGIIGVEKKKPVARRVWNKMRENEILTILRIARDHPELTPRLLAVKITDEQAFSVSESTVYRVLKAHGLVSPRPLDDMPAAKEWRHKTTHPDEIWQCDATNFFVVGWGYYKAIPVEDDYSRKILACPVMPDETSMSISDAVEQAQENAKKEGHTLQEKPLLLSDNGAGFGGHILAEYLGVHGIRHIFGRPYHPQTQGKVESFNKKLKKKVCLVVYCSPEDLRRAVQKAVDEYNVTPHEALKNVNPNDVYLGNREEILKRRQEKKQLTIQTRKQYNLERPAQTVS